jgi:hypothetical protein
LYQIKTTTDMKATINTTKYYESRSELARGEWNDCAVRAIAYATSEKYETIHALAAQEGRQNGRGMRTYQMEQVLKKLYIGLELNFSEFLRQAKWNRRNCPTLSQVLRMPKFQTGAHVVTVKGHAYAIVDGQVAGNSVEGSRCRVEGFVTVDTGIIDTDKL